MDNDRISYIENEIFIEEVGLLIDKYIANQDISVILENGDNNQNKIIKAVSLLIKKVDDKCKEITSKFFNKTNNEFEKFLLKVAKPLDNNGFLIDFRVDPEETYMIHKKWVKLINDNYGRVENYPMITEYSKSEKNFGKPRALSLSECVKFFHKYEELSNDCKKLNKVIYEDCLKDIASGRFTTEHKSIIIDLIHVTNLIEGNLRALTPENMFKSKNLYDGINDLIKKNPKNIKLIPNKFRNDFDLK